MKKKLLKMLKGFWRKLKWEFKNLRYAEPPPICTTKHKWKSYPKDKTQLRCKRCGVIVARVTRMRWGG